LAGLFEQNANLLPMMKELELAAQIYNDINTLQSNYIEIMLPPAKYGFAI